MGLVDHELQQLNGFHERLAALDSEGQASLLRNGFLPESAESLAEAGIRCIPLIESGNIQIADGAVDRLEAVLFKLRLLPEDRKTREVTGRFEVLVREHQRQERANATYGLAFILGLTALVGGLIALIVFLVTR